MAQISQLPGPLDISMVAGDDFTFTIKSSISLSGYTLAASSGAVTFTVTSTPGMPVGYYYDVTITKAQSATFSGSRQWRFEWDDPNAMHRRFASGVIRIVP